jgi:5-methylcytosine-specific restriction endonuclease McrA
VAVTAKVLRYIIASGGANAEFIHVAEAMERGDDAWRMFSLVREMEDDGQSPHDIGVAVVRCADSIKEDWLKEYSGPVTPDPYRTRLGLSASAWRKLREAVFDRDGVACTYCGSPDNITVDHAIPLTRGGTNDLENLTPACKPCNSSKGNKLVSEWLGE